MVPLEEEGAVSGCELVLRLGTHGVGDLAGLSMQMPVDVHILTCASSRKRVVIYFFEPDIGERETETNTGAETETETKRDRGRRERESVWSRFFSVFQERPASHLWFRGKEPCCHTQLLRFM